MKKPKLAIVTLHPHNYGGVLASMRAAYQWAERHFEPTLFFLGFDSSIATNIKSFKYASSVRHTSYFGMRSVEVGARWGFWEPGQYVYTLPVWRAVLAEYEYCIAVSGTVLAAHPLLLLKKKCMVWAATTYDEDRVQRVSSMGIAHRLIDRFSASFVRDYERTILQNVNAVVAMSGYAARTFTALAPQKSFAVCGVPVAVPTRHERRKKQLIAVARFSDPRKNVAMLLRAFGIIAAHDASVGLVLVGQQPTDEQLRPFRDCSWFDRVTCTGMVDREPLHGLYAQSCVMLISSFQEGLGIAGIEAMMHGLPVVTTDCGGPRDFVVDGSTGFIVPCDDHEAMAQRTLRLVHDAILYENMSKQARALANERYSLPAVYSILDETMQRVWPELNQMYEMKL